MAGWVAKFLSTDESESKGREPDLEDKSENQTSNLTSGGGIASYISGLLWSSAEVASAPVDSHESKRDSWKDNREREPKGKATERDQSWENVDMADLRPKVVTSPPGVEVASSENNCQELGQQLSDLQRKVQDLEGVVQTQGKQKKDQHKGSKWPLKLKKQPSKDKGDECAQAIQAKETQIRAKESEIRERDAQIRFYQRKLNKAEALDEQSAQLAIQLSEKDNKLQEVSRQLLDLQQEMKTVIAKNAALKERVAEDQTKHDDEIKKLTANLKKQAESHVEVVLVSNEDSEQDRRSEKEETAQLRIRIATLEADLDKSVVHSKAQSREILKLKQHIQGTELENKECMESNQGLLDEYEGRVNQLQQQLRQVRLERDNLKSECDKFKRKQDKLSTELQLTHQAHQAEARKRKLLEAQMDDDSTQCPKAKCIKVKKGYDTLAAENQRLQDNIVHLSSISEEHREQTQTIIDLNKNIQDLKGRLATTQLQAESNKLDFEAERKDREAAHSKLADLERELARERGHIDVERATYKKHFGEYQQGLKGSAVSCAELKKQKEKTEKEKGKFEKEVEKLQSELAKHKVEAEKAHEEVRAKVSQVRQYKKENDRLKAQLDQSVSSMFKLTDEMETMRKKSKKKGDDPQKRLSASALPDKSIATEKRVAEMEKLCDRFQTENRDLREDVASLTKVIEELKKFLKQDPCGGATQHEEGQGGPQSLPALGNDSQTVGIGELHRQIPAQLPLPTKESHPAAKPTSAPLQAMDPEHQHQQPPQTVPFHAPKSPSPVIQRGNVAEDPNICTVGPNQLGSPQHAPAQFQLKAPYGHPQGVHSYDHSKAHLHVNQYSQPFITHPATMPGAYSYDSAERYGGEQPISSNFSQNPNNQSQYTREGPTTYNPNKYTGGSQPATYPIHPSSDYQPAATASAPQYQTQSRLGDQPQHHSQPQPQPHKGPPQPVPGYKLNHESATKSEGQEARVQQGPRPAQEYGPNRKTAISRGQPGTHLQQKHLGYEPNPQTTVRREERPEPHTQQPDQPQHPPENDQEEDDEDLQFQNRLQNQVDDEIHREASEVIQQVSGGRRHIKTDRQRPFDPNLVCPMCMRQFRIGEIQKFKYHVNTCDGTDDTVI